MIINDIKLGLMDSIVHEKYFKQYSSEQRTSMLKAIYHMNEIDTVSLLYGTQITESQLNEFKINANMILKTIPYLLMLIPGGNPTLITYKIFKRLLDKCRQKCGNKMVTSKKNIPDTYCEKLCRIKATKEMIKKIKADTPACRKMKDKEKQDKCFKKMKNLQQKWHENLKDEVASLHKWETKMMKKGILRTKK